jgi:ComF family protein
MGFLDLIFPPRCGGCGAYGSTWCRGCAALVTSLPPGMMAGIPLITVGRLDGPLQRAVHSYKYRPRPELATALATSLAGAVRKVDIEISVLTFVPLHPARERERGFNQAERLAHHLGQALGLPVIAGLCRVRATPAQVGLGEAERRANVVGAFAWSAAQRPPEGLALVDDVCTTGATLEAAAEAVARAGGSIGAFLALARAQTLPALAVTLPGQSTCP